MLAYHYSTLSCTTTLQCAPCECDLTLVSNDQRGNQAPTRSSEKHDRVSQFHLHTLLRNSFFLRMFQLKYCGHYMCVYVWKLGCSLCIIQLVAWELRSGCYGYSYFKCLHNHFLSCEHSIGFCFCFIFCCHGNCIQWKVLSMMNVYSFIFLRCR